MAISYVVDVYRGTVEASCNPLAFVAAINFFNEGLSLATTQVLVFALAMATGYAVAPYLASAVYGIKTALKRAALRPIVVRPPVRFTCESI